MEITLHDESIDIELGQKVIFYHYQINDNNELEVLTEETFVDVINEKYNIVGFKNGVRSCTLHFYQNDQFGERFFLNDTKENRLRYLRSKVKYYWSEQRLIENDIKNTYALLERYRWHKEEIEHTLDSVNSLIEQLSDASNK